MPAPAGAWRSCTGRWRSASEASAEEFRAALTEAFAAEDVDAVVAGFIPPLVTVDADVAVALAEVAAEGDKTCVATFLGMHGVTEALSSSSRTVPAYPTPEDSVRALVSATRYAQWRSRDRGARVAPKDLQRERARELVEQLTPSDPEGRWLSPRTGRGAARGLRDRGLAGLPGADAGRGGGRGRARRLPGRAEGDGAAAAAPRRPGRGPARHRARGRAAQRPDGDAAAAGAARTRPSSSCRPWRRSGWPAWSAPSRTRCSARSWSSASAARRWSCSATWPGASRRCARGTSRTWSAGSGQRRCCSGYRGAEPVDIDGLEDVVARVSVLADDLQQVAELELNPVMAAPEGVSVLGARVRLAPPPGAHRRRHPPAARLTAATGCVHRPCPQVLDRGRRAGGMMSGCARRRACPPRCATTSSSPATTRTWWPTCSTSASRGSRPGHLVHAETTFDHDDVRRHITVLVLTDHPAGGRARRRPRPRAADGRRSPTPPPRPRPCRWPR